MKKFIMILLGVMLLSGAGILFFRQVKMQDSVEKLDERIAHIEYKEKVTNSLRQEAESKRVEKQFAVQQEYQRVLEDSLTRQLADTKFRQDSYQARVDEILKRKSEEDAGRIAGLSAQIEKFRQGLEAFKLEQAETLKLLEESQKVLENTLKQQLREAKRQTSDSAARLDNALVKLEDYKKQLEEYKQKVREYKKELDEYRQPQAKPVPVK